MHLLYGSYGMEKLKKVFDYFKISFNVNKPKSYYIYYKIKLMDQKPKKIIFQRISAKITILIISILSFGIGLTVLYYSISQNTILIDSRINAIKEESEVVHIAIKNNMLAGEAPIAVELFRDLSKMEGRIKLYRDNGVSAFSDNETLEKVNKNQKQNKFITKSVFPEKEINTEPDFKRSVKDINDIFVHDIKGVKKELIIFKPLLNQPKCSVCHGFDHVIRGILKISTSVDEVYKKSNENTALSVIIYGVVVFILSVSIIVFLHKFVISRVFKIGKVVEHVREGDFKTKIEEKKADEIGILAQQINNMIDGLNERFKLTKFVSKSTLDHIKNFDDISLGGEKKILTVLFTDVRGFTSFSETRDPGDVMNILNEAMNLQGEIVSEFGGDIDKFVGDELMAVFEGGDMALRAVKCAEKIIHSIKKRFSDPERSIQIGIGINTGEMISGNMGTGKRMDRTVIGDAVNLGARLCSIAGKNVIVISEYSYEYVKDKIIAQPHNPVKVKGKSKPVKIYTLRKTL